jgi:hypothetical protein
MTLNAPVQIHVKYQYNRTVNKTLSMYSIKRRHAVVQLVEALRYKLESFGFGSQ